jgi:putative mRNA 3-end processing factor
VHFAGTPGHGQLIATRPTLSLLARKDRRQQPESQLAVPYSRPFTLGELRFELFRSGHTIGSASLLLERDGTRVVYAGAVNPHGGGLGGAADMRRCDVLVVDARYGHPRFAFPDVDETRGEVVAFAGAAMRRGEVPIILVTSPTKGLDVAHQLADTGPSIRAHRTIHHAAQKLRKDGESLPRIKRWDGKLRCGEALLWLDRDTRVPQPSAQTPPTTIALVSGTALDSERVAQLGADAAFAWSDTADYAELLRYIEASDATRVYVTGRYADSLASRLGDVTALGPQRQLNLF